MKAVVLVGGEGTRLRPLTCKTPKALLPIANEVFLERQLRWLGRHGVGEVVLSLGYLPDAFREHFAATRFDGVALRFRQEDEPLGTAGGIRFAAEGIDERVIVCNGDVLTNLDLAALVRAHETTGARATIALTQVADPSAFGVVPTRDDGEVSAFVEKPPPGRAPTDWINAGTYVLEPEVLEGIPPGQMVSIERDTFPGLLERAGALYAFRSDSYWLDIGTPDKFLQAHVDVLAGRLELPPAPGARETSPGIWSQDGAVVASDAAVEAPALIGAGAEIASGARVGGDAVLGAGSSVGAGARVRQAVLLPGARVEPGADVSGTILGPDGELPVPRAP